MQKNFPKFSGSCLHTGRKENMYCFLLESHGCEVTTLSLQIKITILRGSSVYTQAAGVCQTIVYVHMEGSATVPSVLSAPHTTRTSVERAGPDQQLCPCFSICFSICNFK